MAGKKQHFIPQHFLKPFVAPGGGDHLWVYRRGHMSPFQGARRDTAAQNYFYSKPSADGSPTLDDLVTDYESNLHGKVDDIRCMKVGDSIDSEIISEIVTHLAVRSSHLREIVNEAAVSIVGAIQNLIEDESGSFMSELPKRGPPEPLYGMISEELTNLGVMDATPVTESTLIDLLYMMMRERGSSVLDDVRPALVTALQGVRSGAPRMSRRAQISALAKAMAPQERVNALCRLEWQVAPAPAEGAILPDCTSIAFNGREWQPLVLTSSEELQAVVLALSPDRLVVGKMATHLVLDLSRYNRYAADASYSFYVANRNSLDLSELISRPGGKIHSSFKDLAHNTIDEAITRLTKDSSSQPPLEEELRAQSKSWKSTMVGGTHEYFVSFLDIGNETFAKAVAKEIQSIVVAVSRYYPISSLEGFLFANDYEAALNRNDRGFEPTGKVDPIASDKFVGIGMPLAVVSNGAMKTRIVLRAWIAVDLISQEEATKQEAVGIIVHMLASCALRELIATKFPGQILKPVGDPFEAFLHQYSSGIFESYFCALLSTGSREDIDRREKLALEALCEASEKIFVKRLEYIQGGDLEEFFELSASLSARALSLLASLLGSYKAMEEQLPATSAVMKRFTEMGLADWARLFSADLEEFEIGLEEWGRFEEIFFVHRHFQRFMTHFGIVADRHEGDGAYVHVPWTVSDIRALENLTDGHSRLT